MTTLLPPIGAASTGVPDERSGGWPVLAVILGVLIPQTWFSAGKGIGNGDIAPFVAVRRPGELVGVWTHLLDGAGSASFQIARAAEALFWVLPGPPALAQRVFYSALCGALVGSAIWFLAPVSERRWLRSVIALVVLVNPYTMTQAPNPLPLMALIGLALTCGSIYRLWQQPTSSWWVGAGLASLPFSYVVNNPPFLFISVLTVLGFITVCVLRRPTWKFALALVKTLAFALLVNAWWIVATALSLSSGDAGGIETTTNVADWAWTHQRSSILNVLTLNSTWAWPYPEYFPYADRLDNQPWNLLRFGIPILALAAPIVVAEGRRRIVWFGIFGSAVLVFVGKGLHAPLGWLNLRGYEQIPGMWLLREPGAKVGVPLLLVMAALATYTIDGMLDRVCAPEGPHGRAARVGNAIAVSVLVGGSLLYSHPVWTGEVVPRTRPKLPSARVKVPEEWAMAARFLNSHDRTGKVLMLPLRTYYQAETTWGYYGADFVPSLVERPVITATPQSYFGTPPAYETLLMEAADALTGRDRSRLGRAEKLLGAETLVIRRDISESVNAAEELEAAARTLLGPPTFENAVVAVFDALRGRLVTGYEGYADTRPSLAGTPLGSVVFDTPTKVIQVENPSELGLVRGVRRVQVSPGPGGDTLRVETASDVLLDGRPIEPKLERLFPVARVPAVVSSPSVTAILKEPDSTVELSLDPGEVIRFAPLVASRPQLFGEAHSCAGGTAAPVRGVSSAQRIELVAGSGELACVSATQPISPRSNYLSLSYTATAETGRPPCVIPLPGTDCMDLHLTQTDAGGDSRRHMWTGAVTADATAAKIFLYAEGSGSAETLRVFNNVELSWFRSIEQTFQATEEPPRPQRIDPGRYELTNVAPSTAVLGSFGPVGSCGGQDGEGAFRGTASTMTAQLSADIGNSCVTAPITGAQVRSTYSLQLAYRGTGGRTCVWLPAATRCADGTEVDLPVADGWTTRRLTFTVSEPNPVLFLYAASAATVPAEVEYQSLNLVRQPSAEVKVFPLDDSRDDGQATDVRQLRPGKVRVRLNRPGVKTLVLADRYSSKWTLRTLSGTANVGEHSVVNGFANGWVITGDPGAELELAYTPDVVVQAATAVSVAAALAALMLLGIGRWRRGPIRGRDPTILQAGASRQPRASGEIW